jgi:hypothetical protein
LTFCCDYDILLSVAGVMEGCNNGISKSSPITHQAKWLKTAVIVLPVNHNYDDQSVLKQAEQWFY